MSRRPRHVKKEAQLHWKKMRDTMETKGLRPEKFTRKAHSGLKETYRRVTVKGRKYVEIAAASRTALRPGYALASVIRASMDPTRQRGTLTIMDANGTPIETMNPVTRERTPLHEPLSSQATDPRAGLASQPDQRRAVSRRRAGPRR